LYRLISKGGDVYLPLADVVEVIAEMRGIDSTADIIAEDLQIMKEYAMKEVQPLVVSYSMLDLDEMGIKYLTNSRIQNHEFPWADGN
jgi:hypothetical protein